MKLRASRNEPPEIILTPLIDVVFLLLIFFMVSTTFQRDAELAIELPRAEAKPEPSEERTVEVSIDAKGRYYVNGVELVNTQAGTVKQALARAAGDERAPRVVVSADARTPHQAVVTVMDAARQLGFARLSFVTRLEQEATP